MPLYEYKCECGNRFEDLNSIANRHRAECIHCGKMADKVQTPINIDPNADLPGAHLKWQKAAGRRGRGTDMTAANKTVTDYEVLETAHRNRQLNGEGKITTNG